MIRAAPAGVLPALKGLVSSINPTENAANLFHSVRSLVANPQGALSAVKNATPAQVGQNVLAPALVGAGVNEGAGLAAGLGDPASIPASAPAAVRNLGLRTAVDHPIARNVAGPSGREALTAQNQSIVDPTAGAVAGVPHGSPLNATTLEAGREAPNSVYSRAAEHIPTGPLSPTAAQTVQGIGADDLVVHSPDTQATIEAQKQRLLSGPMTGPQVVDTQKALRFNGFRNASSEDPEQLAVGHAQLKMADALHQHMADTLPANAPVSADQLVQARQALAQNHTVENALKGGNVDMQALARINRNNPNMLSGPLKDMAEFGDLHPEVSSLPGAGARYNPAGVGKDITGFDVVHPVGAVARMFGGKVARRALLGSPEAAEAARTATPVRGMGDEFAPLPPGPLQLQPSPGRAFEPNQPQLATGASLAEQPFNAEAKNFSLEAPIGQAFEGHQPQLATDNPQNIELGLRQPEGQAFQQGQRDLFANQVTPTDRLVRPIGMPPPTDYEPPERPTFNGPPSRAANNASNVEAEGGANPASLEAQRRLAAEKAAGTKPVLINPDGDAAAVLHDVTAVDRNPPSGHVIADAKTGKVINSGNMKPAAAQALVNRWKARRPIGEQF